MKFKPTALAAILCATTLGSLALAEPENANRAYAREEARSNALRALGENVEVRWGDHGHIRSVFARNGLQLPSPQSTLERPELVTARLRDVLGFEGAESLVDARLRRLKDDIHYVTFQQEIAGIPVFGSKLAIRYDRYGNATSVSSNITIDKKLPRVPKLTSDAAKAVVIANGGSESSGVKTRLVYFSKSELENHLAWEIIDRHTGISRQHFVDAIDGEYLQGVTMTSHAKYRRIYSANQTDDFDAQLLFVENGSSSDAHANDAYMWAGKFYDHLYSDFEQRDSYDDAGSDIRISVHYRQCVYPDPSEGVEPKPADCTFPPWNNAMYDSNEDWFYFGDGDGVKFSPLGRDADFVSHEIAHGITFDEANGSLGGDEGPAISEALSDIFAASFHYHENPNDLSNDAWKIFEDSYTAGDAVRYMDDPQDNGTGIDNYADRDADKAHDSSGIISLAYYLLSEGGTHPRGYTSTYVPGIGFENARDLVYEGMINCLEPNETMKTWRECLVGRAYVKDTAEGTNFEPSVTKAFDAVCVPPACQPLLPPASISTSSWYCWGQYSVSWSSVSGADQYQLWFSDTTNISNGQPLYTGTATSKVVNIPRSGYVGVKACNGLGCTDFKKSGYLQRLSSCM